MSAPPSETEPASGLSKPAMMRSVVVFPEPDGPSSVKNSPSPTFRSTFSTATTSAYVLRIPVSWTSAAKAGLQDVEAALELVVGDRERGQQPDHVAVDPAGEEHQTALVRRVRDTVRLVAVSLRELDREHRAESADVGPLRRDLQQAFLDAHAELLGAVAQLRQLVE